MSIFDKLKGGIQAAKGDSTFTFAALPESLADLKALPEASLDTPFKTAALAVCALCAYAAEPAIGTEMLDFLRGPRPLSNLDKSFLKDRFMDGKYYVPFSYFKGATPDNDYTPAEPFEITVNENPYSYQNEGYATLYITSGGADSPRPVTLRKTTEGKWCLWQHESLLTSIRAPKTSNPWA